MPEIFLDAPHQLLPGKPLTVWLLVKDADRFPVRVRAVTFTLWDEAGATAKERFEPEDARARCAKPLQHLAFTLPYARFKGRLRVLGRIEVEDARGRRQAFDTHNYPGLPSFPLEIHLLDAPPPARAGWHAGELHSHSEFTSDHVEFGAPLALMQETADAVGLDFVLSSDHSYDFPYHRARYLEPVDPHENYAAYRAQAAALNAARPALPTLIAGEEISCGNARGQNVHLLAFGHHEFIPGNGDGGRRGLNSRPDLTIAEVLERLGDTPAFAAHPAGHRSRMQRLILGRGPWRDEDVRPGPGGRSVRGLQFWNGTLGRDYQDGKAQWISRLLAGQRLLPLGANDAHGDFNHNIHVKIPLVSVRLSRGHLFGRVRTLVPAADKTPAALSAAFRGGGARCLCTDGPFAELVGEDGAGGGALRAHALSTPDFGALASVIVWGASPGDTRERVLAEWTFDGEGPHAFDERVTLPGPALAPRLYARLEVVTRTGRRALTSALFPD